MTAAQTLASPTRAPEHTPRVRVAIRFSIDGDLRFLSHQDERRLLARALRRARWPLAYSQGFNPQPRLALILPRRVGTASACEWAIVELSEPCAVEQLRQNLAAALPPACCLQCVVEVTTRAMPQPRRVHYNVELEPEHAAQAGRRIAGLLAAETVTVERTYGPGKPPRAIDIRLYIETVILSDRTLSVQLAFVDRRTARPTEVLTALSLPAGAYNHRVRRVEVEWDTALTGATPWPVGPERKHVGQQEDCKAQTQKEHDA
ncbi:MAG: TIGR03936 family radical SAM-associated protein [Phycisphaerae bacterium]